LSCRGRNRLTPNDQRSECFFTRRVKKAKLLTRKPGRDLFAKGSETWG
jgi:hypothetical protein